MTESFLEGNVENAAVSRQHSAVSSDPCARTSSETHWVTAGPITCGQKQRNGAEAHDDEARKTANFHGKHNHSRRRNPAPMPMPLPSVSLAAATVVHRARCGRFRSRFHRRAKWQGRVSRKEQALGSLVYVPIGQDEETVAASLPPHRLE